MADFRAFFAAEQPALPALSFGAVEDNQVASLCRAAVHAPGVSLDAVGAGVLGLPDRVAKGRAIAAAGHDDAEHAQPPDDDAGWLAATVSGHVTTVAPRSRWQDSVSASVITSKKERHDRLHSFLFPKLVDEVISDHAGVAGRPLENRPAALVGPEAVALRKLRPGRSMVEQVHPQRLHEQCAQRGAVLSGADPCSPVERIGQVDGDLHRTILPATDRQ